MAEIIPGCCAQTAPDRAAQLAASPVRILLPAIGFRAVEAALILLSAMPAASNASPRSSISIEQIDWRKTNIYAPFWIIKAAIPQPEAGLGVYWHNLRAHLRAHARFI